MIHRTGSTTDACRLSIFLALLAALVASLGAGGSAQSLQDAGHPLEIAKVDSKSVRPVEPATTVILKLADDPVAVVRSHRAGKRMARAEQSAIAQRLRAKQESLVPAIEASGAR